MIIWGCIFIGVAAYGFTITNFSIGVDDPAAIHYLHTGGRGNMLQQGRFFHIIFNWITGMVTFLPFLNDFLGATFFVLSSLLFAGLAKYVAKAFGGVISDLSILVFCGIFISYSIINEKYIYNLDVVVTMLSYVMIALSLIFTYQVIWEKKHKKLLLAVFALILGISAYESFVFVYTEGILFIILIEAVFREDITIRDAFIKGIKSCTILSISMIIYYTIVVFVQIRTGQYNKFSRRPIWEGGITKERIKAVLIDIYVNFTNFDYFPIREFIMVMGLGLAIFFIISIHRKTILIFLIYVGMIVMNFTIHIMAGRVMYSAGQTMCLFVAGTIIVVLHFIEKISKMKVVAYGCCVWLMLLQLIDLNRWFYNDYSRYKKEEFVLNCIAMKLLVECDVSKPVIFANRNWDSYLYSKQNGNQTNGNSMLIWGIGTFDDVGSPTMIEIFKMHGYYFLRQPSQQLEEEGRAIAKSMPEWPLEGSIREFDDYIVVNFKTKIYENKYSTVE